MSETDLSFERRVVETLRAKIAQLPPVTIEFDAAPIAGVGEPPRTGRSRVLVAATIALIVVLVAAGIVAAVQSDSRTLRAPTGDPAGPVVARLRIDALPTLSLQAKEFTTFAGVNEITLVRKGGAESLVFDDPALSSFRLDVPDGRSVGRVELRAGRDYRIHSLIPGHTAAGVEAVIHVLPATSPTNPPLPRAVLNVVSAASRSASGPSHGSAMYVVASRSVATTALMHDWVSDQSPAYVFVLHGSFVDHNARGFSDNTPPPSGNTVILVVSQSSPTQVLDYGIQNSVPDLSTLGGATSTKY